MATGTLVAVVAALALAVAVGLLWQDRRARAATVRRQTADVRLLLDANPEHRLAETGPAGLADLARAVNDLAARRASAERDVAREAASARADVEQERNRLAALMADLTAAVVVCSPGGRIVLYNAAARALLADDPALGLGRSVFGIVDRGLVAHALDRVTDGDTPGHVSTVLRDDRLLQVRLTPVRGADAAVSGFVLLLEDTGRLRARQRQDARLRALAERTRASAGGIRAAVETLLDYPGMTAQEQAQFLTIVAEESARLGEQVQGWAAAAAGTGDRDDLLADVRGEDLLVVLAREVERGAGAQVSLPAPGTGQPWVRADSHALARSLEQLAGRLRDDCGVGRVALSLVPVDGHARLELVWDGPALPAAGLEAWLDEPPPGGVAASSREVVERHDAEVWTGASADGTAHVRLLLPVSEARAGTAPVRAATPESRPEFYDFDLFDLPDQALAWQDRRLSELAYAVFDTETTGFHPDAGDEVLSIGAVRVLHGRLLRQEVFERLVDPGRAVPPGSTQVHGITDEMVHGQPGLDEVLPVFARFCDDTVLVGHNVGFDLSFLRRAESRTGVRFTQPVLDTLLLDAALHPDHERHSLEAIADRFGLDVLGRHTALGDALLTGEVLVRLLALLQQRGITTLGEALEASRKTQQARLDARLYGS